MCRLNTFGPVTPLLGNSNYVVVVVKRYFLKSGRNVISLAVAKRVMKKQKAKAVSDEWCIRTKKDKPMHLSCTNSIALKVIKYVCSNKS